MFEINEYHVFKDGLFQTPFGTVVQCFDGLPPLDFLSGIQHDLVFMESPTYLGRRVSDVKRMIRGELITRTDVMLQNILDRFSRVIQRRGELLDCLITTSKKVTSVDLLKLVRNVTGLSLYDGYNRAYSSRIVRAYFSLPVYIGTYVTKEPIYAPNRGRVVIYDEEYDVYLILPSSVQWVARTALPPKQEKYVKNVMKSLFGIEKEPLVTYRYSFGGFYALLGNNKGRRLLIHNYRSSSSSRGSTQKYLMYQADKRVMYTYLHEVRKRKFDWFVKAVSVIHG